MPELSEREQQLVFRKIHSVDQSKVLELVAHHGLEEAAHILGYDVSNPENIKIAGRLVVTQINRTTPQTLREYVEAMGQKLHDKVARFIYANLYALQEAVDQLSHLNYRHTYFSIVSMMKSHLNKSGHNGKVIERPEYMFMRVAVMIRKHYGVSSVISMFEDMMHGRYTPATPTLSNIGTERNSGISCFMMAPDDDLISIKDVDKHVALNTKANAAQGISLTRLRHSSVRGIGMSRGVLAWTRTYNSTIEEVDQLTRPGAATLYLNPFHIDTLDFINEFEKVRPNGKPALTARGCIWLTDIFKQRLEEDGMWTFFCPHETPGLDRTWGKEHTELYLKYEKDSSIRVKKTVKISELWTRMMQSIFRTGSLHIMDGDACNRKSNHRASGVCIPGANLCLETVQRYDINENTSPETSRVDIASCNLSSLSLRSCVHSGVFCFDQLAANSRAVVQNLDSLIDINNYPSEGAKANNMKYRSIGIGVSGLAEVFKKMRVPYDSEAAFTLNKKIFACIYFNSLCQSVDLAIKRGAYSTFRDSPAAQGKLQFDLWAEEFAELGPTFEKGAGGQSVPVRTKEMDSPMNPTEWGQQPFVLSNGHVIEPNWKSLKNAIKLYGLRNSLITMCMPTASTSQILRNSEMFEPAQTNLYTRRVGSGTFVVADKYLHKELAAVGAWNDATYNFLKATRGSVKGLDKFILAHPELYSSNSVEKLAAKVSEILPIFKTAFEISNRVYIRMSAERGRYLDHSQSFNLYMDSPSEVKISAAVRHGIKHGLKTLVYYLRSVGSNETLNVTIDPAIESWVSENLGLKITRPPSPVREIAPAAQEEGVCYIREDGTKSCCE